MFDSLLEETLFGLRPLFNAALKIGDRRCGYVSDTFQILFGVL